MASVQWPCIILALLSGLVVPGFPRSPSRLLEVNLSPIHHPGRHTSRGTSLGGPLQGEGEGEGWAVVSCRGQGWVLGELGSKAAI